MKGNNLNNILTYILYYLLQLLLSQNKKKILNKYIKKSLPGWSLNTMHKKHVFHDNSIYLSNFLKNNN